MVKFLLQHRPTTDRPDDRGETPLLAAVRAGSLDIYLHLLKKKAKVEAKTSHDENALHLAAASNKTKMMEKLLEEPSMKSSKQLNARTRPDMNTALHLAVLSGQYTAVKVLLGHEEVDVTMMNKKNETAVTLAAKLGDLSVLKLICEKRRTLPSEILQHALLEAVVSGAESACEFLMTSQDLRLDVWRCKDDDGNNALHKVARNGSHSIAKKLLEHWTRRDGGDGDIEGVLRYHKRMVMEALKAKASSGLNEGMTPFSVAEVCDNEPITRLFHAYLFDPKTTAGALTETSVDHAEDEGNARQLCVPRGCRLENGQCTIV